MVTIKEITNIDDPEVAPFYRLTEASLRRSTDKCSDGVFIAESPKVIGVAIDAGYEPLSILCERRHIAGDASGIIARCSHDLTVYTGDRGILSQLTGYTLTRGVLALMKRKPDTCLDDLCREARRLAVIDGVTDTTNIGAIFRSAVALGVDCVLLTRSTCDPLNRRSVRVSMGSVFLIDWGWLPDGDITEILRPYGIKTAAMALTDNSICLDDPRLSKERRLAVILGTEGDGLKVDVIRNADYIVRIPMAHNVDSLNVAAASAVAFWQLRPLPGIS